MSETEHEEYIKQNNKIEKLKEISVSIEKYVMSDLSVSDPTLDRMQTLFDMIRNLDI